MFGKAFVPVLALTWLAQGDKTPIPQDAEIRKAEKSIRTLFAPEYKAKDRPSRRMFAQKLLEQAPGTTDPAERFVLLREARDIAAEAFDFETSFAASAKLAESYAGPLTGATFTLSSSKLEALNRARGASLGPEESAAVADHFLKLAEEAAKAAEFDIATKAVQSGEQLAKTANDPALVKRSIETSKEMTFLKNEYEAALKAEPLAAKGDPDACGTWGKFLLFVKGETEKGLQFLSKCGDPVLRGAALKEGAKPGAEGAIEAAEAWWSVSEKEKAGFDKRRCQGRAYQTLEQAFPTATGLSKAKIERRMDEMDQTISGVASVDLLRILDPTGKDKVEGTWQLTGQGLISPVHMAATHRMQIPYCPDSEYNVKAMIEKKSGFWIGIGIVGGGVQVPIQKFGEHEAGQVLNILIEVRKGGYKVWRDGKVLTEWKGDWKSFPGLNADWKMPNDKSLFLMSGGSFVFSKLQLKPISGMGKKLR